MIYDYSLCTCHYPRVHGTRVMINSIFNGRRFDEARLDTGDADVGMERLLAQCLGEAHYPPRGHVVDARPEARDSPRDLCGRALRSIEETPGGHVRACVAEAGGLGLSVPFGDRLGEVGE